MARRREWRWSPGATWREGAAVGRLVEDVVGGRPAVHLPLLKHGSMSGASQITVVVRVRPISESEKTRRNFQCVFPLDKQRLLLVDPEKYDNNVLRQNRQHERQFSFDAAFGPNSSQEDVHAATTGPMVDSVVAGYNATVFAYGATGAGKTYTMVGTKDNPGVMTLLTQSLYEKINLREYQVHLSYLEIYNEVIRDLLNPSSGMLDLMEDERGNIRVPGLSTVNAPNINRIMQILQEGNQRRTQEATGANLTSSRSHALLQVTLLRNNRQHGKLFLIDLAGSERASNTNNRGQRLKEGAAINRSLLALGNVINSLTQKGQKYVNYRDSKLTRLLKDSLGGSAKTCMIAHVSPASGNYEETYNTLVYANRAKNITNKVTRNRPLSADQPYTDAMRELRKDLNKRMPHAASTNQLHEMRSDRDKTTTAASKRWNNNTSTLHTRRSTHHGSHLPTVDAKENERSPLSLFSQLKEQFITTSDKQHKLRERLMKANQEACEVEMSRASKTAILGAWDRQQTSEAKLVESIERLRQDVDEQNTRLNTLLEVRRKVEKALKKGSETLDSIENRLRSLAHSKEQKEVVELLVKMANIRAEKIAVMNDLAIQAIVVRKTDNSMAKLQKYETLADKLIEGKLEDDDRAKLAQEYRIMKNQFHYQLVPLRNLQPLISWNSQLLPRIDNSSSGTDDVDKAYMVSRKKRDSVQLPRIQRPQSPVLSEPYSPQSANFPIIK